MIVDCKRKEHKLEAAGEERTKNTQYMQKKATLQMNRNKQNKKLFKARK